MPSWDNMTTTRLWPDWLDEIWGKSPEREGQKHGEGLAQHTWGVLEMLAQLIRLRSDLPTTLGFPPLWHCLFWACFLHDFGKAARGFQDMLRGGRWPHRHEVLSLAFLQWISDALTAEERQWVGAAIVSHHRDAHEIQLLYMDPGEPVDDPLLPLVREIGDSALDGLWRWLTECPTSWIEALGLGGAGIRLPALLPGAEAARLVREQGAVTVRESLRAYRSWLRALSRSQERGLIIGTLALRGYMISSDHMASARTGALPQPNLRQPSELLTRWQLQKDRLYAHQEACLATRGMTVLMAPTGSGKTEAALLWACAQGNGRHPIPRLFYALPYQASMNAMYDRLQERSFPNQVGLEHSRSTLAVYRHLLGDDCGPEEAQHVARWHRKLARLHYFPVRVLSPYQILKAPYRLKGYEALFSDFFNAAFIFDEIHAYEAERLAAILSTVKYLREEFGATFFVMSATLPRLLRARVADALGQHTFIQATPELFERFRRHRLCLMDGDLLADQRLGRIVEAARRGESVLVCCNTVKRVQQVYHELRARLEGRSELVLLHGRFNGKDRLGKEAIVRRATGSRSGHRRPIVLIATQVIEVSLDIDLDVIYSDPAPLEALVQRFGRVNRRRMKKCAPVYVSTQPAEGQGVYEEDLVRGTLAALAKRAEQVIDEEHISDWLDEVYEGDIADRWNQAYERAYCEFERACLRTLRAFNADDQLEELFYRAFDSVEVLPANLEQEYRQLVQDSPLEASELLVPLRWGQFCKLRSSGKVGAMSTGWPKVVDLQYDSELGLRTN